MRSEDNTKDEPSSALLSKHEMEVTSLARYAVKGLGPDLLTSVHISNEDSDNDAVGETFPDDRRFALLKYNLHDDQTKFDPNHPKWIHKEKFLCAFTAPQLMASLRSKYRILRHAAVDDDNNHLITSQGGDDKCTLGQSSSLPSFGLPNDRIITSKDGMASHPKDQKLLTLWDRKGTPNNDTPSSPKPILGPIDLNTEQGRNELASFFTNRSNQTVTCITAFPSPQPSTKSVPIQNSSPPPNGNGNGNGNHKHQFGNTRSGVKHNHGNTRTVHIVNAATVRQLSEKIGVQLDPMRFRPNIVVDGLEPWREFDFVGGSIRLSSRNTRNDNSSIEENDLSVINDEPVMELDVISTTVRCAGIGIDPMDPNEILDMPALLNEHFPQYGPYLGVYAVIRQGGFISLGDTLEFLDFQKG